MVILKIFIWIMVLFLAISFIYKFRYHMKAKNVDNMPAFTFYFYRHLMIMFPLRQRPHNAADNILRKKANIALYIFYAAFVLIIITSLFVPPGFNIGF